jgi:mannose-binding lectin 1
MSPWLAMLLLVDLCAAVEERNPHHNTVEHHSLIGPFISEWWQGGVPHWDFGASAVITDKYVRVAPDKQSRTGWLWNDQANHLTQWEALLSFRIHSRRNPGADGLALWYVETPSKYDPNNKGSQPNLWGNNVDFKGLGIIFDTYDNDGQRDNPVVSVIYGAGDPNQKWDIENDLNAQAKMRCVYEFRNTPKHSQVKARIVYADKTLRIFLSTAEDEKETYCGQVENLEMPTGYYFGITASTGHLADNHDVYGFVVTAAPEAIKQEDQKIYGDVAPHRVANPDAPQQTGGPHVGRLL